MQLAIFDSTLSDEVIAKLHSYSQLLSKWNKVYSLTSHIDADAIMTYHIFDGLSIVKYVTKYQPETILDVGSGMGVPGIVVALCLPQTKFTLIDVNQKKAAFLQQVVIELNLVNVEVICARVEQWQNCQQKYQIITARAFSTAVDLINKTKQLATENSRWLLMKSKQVFNEIQQLASLDLSLKHELIKLKLPNLDDERYLLVVAAE